MDIPQNTYLEYQTNIHERLQFSSPFILTLITNRLPRKTKSFQVKRTKKAFFISVKVFLRNDFPHFSSLPVPFFLFVYSPRLFNSISMILIVQFQTEFAKHSNQIEMFIFLQISTQ